MAVGRSNSLYTLFGRLRMIVEQMTRNCWFVQKGIVTFRSIIEKYGSMSSGKNGINGVGSTNNKHYYINDLICFALGLDSSDGKSVVWVEPMLCVGWPQIFGKTPLLMKKKTSMSQSFVKLVTGTYSSSWQLYRHPTCIF